MNFLFSTPAKVCRCGTSIKLSTFIILCVCVCVWKSFILFQKMKLKSNVSQANSFDLIILC